MLKSSPTSEDTSSLFISEVTKSGSRRVLSSIKIVLKIDRERKRRKPKRLRVRFLKNSIQIIFSNLSLNLILVGVIGFTAWFILVPHNNISAPDKVNTSALFLREINTNLLSTLPH